MLIGGMIQLSRDILNVYVLQIALFQLLRQNSALKLNLQVTKQPGVLRCNNEDRPRLQRNTAPGNAKIVYRDERTTESD